MPETSSRRRPLLIFLLIAVPVLLFIGWSQASFNLAFIHPNSAGETILLVVLSILIALAFVIFALILARVLLKLYVERRAQKLGSRFKTRMVVAFLALTLVPVSFLFIFAYLLLNRSIDKWFGIPLDVVRNDADDIVRELQIQAKRRSERLCARLAALPPIEQAATGQENSSMPALLSSEMAGRQDEAALYYAPDGRLIAEAGSIDFRPSKLSDAVHGLKGNSPPGRLITAEAESGRHKLFLCAVALHGADGQPLGTLVAAARLPPNVERIAAKIEIEAQKYGALSHEQKTVRRTYLLSLSLITLLILFAATWLALFISKQVTVPIQALASATHEVSGGNLGYRVSATGSDELGTLIHSFNEMTAQLEANRIALERAAADLHAANRELDERGNTMEAILENIPAGVISLNPQGQITRVNTAAARMLGGERAPSAQTLSDLFAPEQIRVINWLFRRARRQGVVTRQMELPLAGRNASVAMTLTSIRASHGAVGSILVLEDLTDLLQAQRAAAWQEVAQRIAHEIKNPLTPIRLSAERMRRRAERADGNAADRDLLEAVTQSSSLIEREVETLKTLVDEFSDFARFPASKLVTADLNAIVMKAVEVFDGRLNGIRIHRSLCASFPPLQADPEQMKRALVNLIDNAAEALEHASLKEIWISTALDPGRDAVEIVVADSGPGIPPEAKERLFLPFFSTKRRGTGLGLAIVSRIVTEHNGSIRVEENRPAGTRFVIELPLEHAPGAVPNEA
jgi:two-component system, NtrC family, nitrogen regulation sensor histidine kinase NtrY